MVLVSNMYDMLLIVLGCMVAIAQLTFYMVMELVVIKRKPLVDDQDLKRILAPGSGETDAAKANAPAPVGQARVDAPYPTDHLQLEGRMAQRLAPCRTLLNWFSAFIDVFPFMGLAGTLVGLILAGAEKAGAEAIETIASNLNFAITSTLWGVVAAALNKFLFDVMAVNAYDHYETEYRNQLADRLIEVRRTKS